MHFFPSNGNHNFTAQFQLGAGFAAFNSVESCRCRQVAKRESWLQGEAIGIEGSIGNQLEFEAPKLLQNYWPTGYAVLIPLWIQTVQNIATSQANFPHDHVACWLAAIHDNTGSNRLWLSTHPTK